MSISGNKVGKAVCDALGIASKNVRCLTIVISANSAVTVTVDRYLEGDELKKIVELIEADEPVIVDARGG